MYGLLVSCSSFLELVVSSESGNSSSEEGAEYMELQSAIALSLKERLVACLCIKTVQYNYYVCNCATRLFAPKIPPLGGC